METGDSAALRSAWGAMPGIGEQLAPGLELIRPISSGVRSAVFLAREPALRRLVAVKILAPELVADPKARARFEREAQTAAQLTHPHVVALHRVGELGDGRPYLVMQHVEGRSLADRLRADGPLPVPEAVRILAEVASALAAAHERGIAHRDLTPSNVLLEQRAGRALLTDFGIAALLPTGAEGSRRLTTAGRPVGDPFHTSPELLRGEEPTALADVYGLAVLGYEILTGRGPYEAGTRLEVSVAHLEAEPVRLGDRVPVPEDLEALLLRCLAKRPEHRPASADLAHRLAALADACAGRPASVAGPTAAPGAGAAPLAAAPHARPDSAVGKVRLVVLGRLDVAAADGRRVLSVLSKPKRVALLAYLAIGAPGAFVRRDTLLGLLWPELDQERARHALRQALYTLRRGVGADVVLSRGSEEIGLDPARLWCDAVVFEAAIEAGELEPAAELYAGDLLPGFFLPDAPEFERWLDGERLRLRRRASEAARSLAGARESAGDTAGALGWARRAAALSPYDESALCRLLELLDRTGDRAGALREYERFAARLREEFGTEPSPESRGLIARIRER